MTQPTENDDQLSNGIDIGNRLRELRLKRGLTQGDVAERCGMSAAVLSRKETGKQAFNRTDLTRLIPVLKLTPEEAFELWCDAGMVAATLPSGFTNGAMHVAGEQLGAMDVPALLLGRDGTLRAWNGCAEVIFQAKHINRYNLHILDVLAAWRIPGTEEQQQHEVLSTLLGCLAVWLCPDPDSSLLEMVLQRLPAAPAGNLIRACLPTLMQRKFKDGMRDQVPPVVAIPTSAGTIPFVLTYCPQTLTCNVVVMTLIPKYPEGTDVCDRLRRMYQDMIQTVYVCET